MTLSEIPLRIECGRKEVRVFAVGSVTKPLSRENGMTLSERMKVQSELFGRHLREVLGEIETEDDRC